MRKHLETEIKVGLFVTIGVGLIMLAILLLGGTESFFSRSYRYHANFNKVDGLITGAKVILGGVPVGTVNLIKFDKQKGGITIDFAVTADAKDLIRSNSTVEIATQGVLGDKYLSIEAGADDQPPLEPGSEIPHRVTKDISQFLNKGDQLMVSLNALATSLDRILKTFDSDNRSETFFKSLAATAKSISQMTEKLNQDLNTHQLKTTLGQLSEIFEKINNGTGTIGALVNDPSLYDEVRALMGGANRNRIIRNLVRQTIQESETKGTPPTMPTPTSKSVKEK